MNKISGGFLISGFDGDFMYKKPEKMQAISIRYISNQKSSLQVVRQMVDSDSFFKMSRCTGKFANVAPIAAITSFFDDKISPFGINAGLS